MAKKIVKKKPVDNKPVELTLKDTVQKVRVYPKYNPLRKIS
tara:strand:+ start:3783 stop:3905 length:123 start_codon:yes stop_codon:yes gene_type:complete